jgi:hypothetical protein
MSRIITLFPKRWEVDWLAPWFQRFGEAYIHYTIEFGKNEVGQSVSVSFLTRDGLNLPPLLAGACIHPYEQLAFITPETANELVRRLFQLMPTKGMVYDPEGSSDHEQGDGPAGEPQPVDG